LFAAWALMTNIMLRRAPGLAPNLIVHGTLVGWLRRAVAT